MKFSIICINKCNPQERDRSRVIFEKGCLQSGEEWAEKNLLPLAGVVLAVAFAQVCYCVFEFWEGKVLSTNYFFPCFSYLNLKIILL